MDGDTSSLANSYMTPWTLRVFSALPGNPVSIGIAFTILLLTLFFAGRAIVDGARYATQEDLRIAITQIFITTFSASAYAYLLMTARKTTQDLAPVAGGLSDWRAAVDRAGKHPWWSLPLIGAGSFLLVGVPVTNATSVGDVSPWLWQHWNHDVFWHRGTTLLFAWWIGCLCHVILVESIRLSRLTGEIRSVDLLDMQPYQPLIRQGLTNALLVIGMVSLLSLFAVESRYVPVLVGFWLAFIAMALTGMMLPLRGIRKRLKVARVQELAWCRQSLLNARDALKSGEGEQQSIAEIVAYQALIESMKKWPFDSPTLVRFTLYLLIPLGSWLGGAFVERGLDFILS